MSTGRQKTAWCGEHSFIHPRRLGNDTCLLEQYAYDFHRKPSQPHPLLFGGDAGTTIDCYQ